MKVEERGAPGFSKEYINRRQRICSEICGLIHLPSFTYSCPLTHSHPHKTLCVMTPILLICSSKQSRPQLWQSAALHSLCVILISDLHPLWGRPSHTFNKIFLITMQTCTEEKFCTLAITARERSQLLQLITCSDGLADTWYRRSVALTVPLRGHLHPMKDF